MKRLVSLLLALGMLLGCGLAGGAMAAGDDYKDVSESAWYYDDVQLARTLGLMDGKADGQFAPNDPLKLSEAVTLASRVCSLFLKDGEKFARHDAWYTVYVEYALAHGILKSAYEDFTVNATRQRCAELFASALPAEGLQAVNTVEDGAIPDVKEDAAVYALYRAGVLSGYDDTASARIRRSAAARSRRWSTACFSRKTGSASR